MLPALKKSYAEDDSSASDEDRPILAHAPARRLGIFNATPSTSQSLAANLPAEIIFDIFMYLQSARDLYATLLTCQSWCACSVEMLWYKPFLYHTPALIKLLKTIRKPTATFDYPRFVRRLNLSFLQEYIADAIMLKLSSCQNLERLTLTSCSRVTDRGLCDVVSRNPELIALDVHGLLEITDLSILCLARRAVNLQGLNLTGCVKIRDDAITTIANSCRSMRRIKLNGCALLTSKSVTEIAKNCPYLLELDVDHCHLITSPSVNLLIKLCPDLRELRLNMCTQIGDECFSDLERDCYPNLRVLDVAGCARITDESVYHIVTAAPKLRSLVLAKCPSITDRGAVQIARLGKHVHFLHLGHCSNLTDRTLQFLVKYCSRLRYIDLACCVQLTNQAVSELSTLPRLKRIGLVKCSAITADAILALVERGQVPLTLERIHLSYCIDLTLACIRALLNACRHLTHLSLTGVPAFLRHDLRRFCRASPKDFHPNQAAVFCVFSGSGVEKLRDYLNSLHDMNMLVYTPIPLEQHMQLQNMLLQMPVMEDELAPADLINEMP